MNAGVDAMIATDYVAAVDVVGTHYAVKRQQP